MHVEDFEQTFLKQHKKMVFGSIIAKIRIGLKLYDRTSKAKNVNGLICFQWV